MVAAAMPKLPASRPRSKPALGWAPPGGSRWAACRVRVDPDPLTIRYRPGGAQPARRPRAVGGRRHGARPLHPDDRGRDRARGAGAPLAGSCARRSRARVSDSLALTVALSDGSPGRLELGLHRDRLVIELTVERAPLRLGARWGAGPRRASDRPRRPARHRLRPDAGAASSSAPTAATPAPTARPRCSTQGGIPQGDYAPVPWLLSSAATRVWLETDGQRAPTSSWTRAASRCPRASAAGPLRLHLCHRSHARGAAARLLPPDRASQRVLPEWGYGHWKSRDVYEHAATTWWTTSRATCATSCRSTRS